MATVVRFQTTTATRVATAAEATDVDPLGGSSRLMQLLTRMEKLLTERYAFDVFKANAINFGIVVTYRQKWEPRHYQVGDLVKALPMAPKEIVRYTTRTVTRKTRATKEIEDSLQTRRSESADTTRVDGEIVGKALERTNFNLSATETFGGEGMSISATQSGGGESRKESARTKREFRESVLRSAQEYRQQHRMEVDVTETSEFEETSFHEIQNPNDELAVTYLFYELQRQYRISERLHRLTPVILVANAVPAPHEIDDAWLIEHDWILRRAILDDSFRPALEYLTKSFTGAEINIRILEAHAKGQKELVDNLNQQIQVHMAVLAANQESVGAAVSKLAKTQESQGLFESVKRIFDPIGLTGGGNQGAIDAAQAMVDYQKETVDNAQRERARLLSQLDVAVSALQAAVDKLSNAVKEHYDRVTEIDRLRVHVKENILYYMQAIWRQEPPDQRFFRLYDLDVPIVTADRERRRVSDKRRGPAGTAGPLRSLTRERHGQSVTTDVGDRHAQETVGGRRPRQRARVQGQLHGVRAQGEQLPDASHDAGLPGGRRRVAHPRPGRARRLQHRRPPRARDVCEQEIRPRRSRISVTTSSGS